MGRDIGCGGPVQSGVLKPKAGDGSMPRLEEESLLWLLGTEMRRVLL